MITAKALTTAANLARMMDRSGSGIGEEQFDGAGFAFLGKEAHGEERRNQQEDNAEVEKERPQNHFHEIHLLGHHGILGGLKAEQVIVDDGAVEEIAGNHQKRERHRIENGRSKQTVELLAINRDKAFHDWASSRDGSSVTSCIKMSSRLRSTSFSSSRSIPLSTTRRAISGRRSPDRSVSTKTLPVSPAATDTFCTPPRLSRAEANSAVFPRTCSWTWADFCKLAGEVGGTIGGDDLALVDDQHPLADLRHLRENMTAQKNRVFFPQFLDQAADFDDLSRVQADGGFVENQDRGVVQECLRQSNPLSEAFGEMADHAMGRLFQTADAHYPTDFAFDLLAYRRPLPQPQNEESPVPSALRREAHSPADSLPGGAPPGTGRSNPDPSIRATPAVGGI